MCSQGKLYIRFVQNNNNNNNNSNNNNDNNNNNKTMYCPAFGPSNIYDIGIDTIINRSVVDYSARTINRKRNLRSRSMVKKSNGHQLRIEIDNIIIISTVYSPI